MTKYCRPFNRLPSLLWGISQYLHVLCLLCQLTLLCRNGVGGKMKWRSIDMPYSIHTNFTVYLKIVVVIWQVTTRCRQWHRWNQPCSICSYTIHDLKFYYFITIAVEIKWLRSQSRRTNSPFFQSASALF